LAKRDDWAAPAKLRSSDGQLFATLADGGGAACSAAPSRIDDNFFWLASSGRRAHTGTVRPWRRCVAGRCVPPQGRPHPAWEEASMRTDLQSLLLGGLLVAVIALGYLYWERQRNTVEIKLPSITIEKH